MNGNDQTSGKDTSSRELAAELRSLRARMAAYCLHAKRDPVDTTRAARAAIMDASSDRSILIAVYRRPSGAGAPTQRGRHTSSSSP